MLCQARSAPRAFAAGVHGAGVPGSMREYLLHCVKIEAAGYAPEGGWLGAADQAKAGG